MCTVTWLPKGENNFIITSNRDENPHRIALPPQKYSVDGVDVYYPKDSQAGGTWFAAGHNGFVLVLLNGADVKHHHRPPNRKSRGVMLLDFFGVNNALIFATQYNFEGIEPFTLVIADSVGNTLHQLRWNGTEAWIEEKAVDEPHIWSSATLYTPETIALRREWFSTWLGKEPEFTMANARNFHHFGGSGDIYNDIKMNREGRVQTVSITSFEKEGSSGCLVYEDLADGQLYPTTISFE